MNDVKTPILETLDRMVDEELTRCEQVARSQLGAAFPRPQVDWTLKGRSAGQAWGFEKIRLNRMVAQSHPERLKETVAHEYAHSVTEFLRARTPRATRKGEWSSHGARWGSVMTAFGYEASRTHSMEVVASRTVTRYEYRCNCRSHALTNVWHQKAVRAAKTGRGVRCRDCRGALRPVMNKAGTGVAVVPIRRLSITKEGFAGLAVWQRLADSWRCAEVSSAALSFLKTVPVERAKDALLERGYLFVWQ